MTEVQQTHSDVVDIDHTAAVGPWRARLRSLLLTRRVDRLASLALVLGLGLHTLVFPFARDQAEYAVIARIAQSGKAIYRDVFNVKPPMTHVLHELALTVFGSSMLSIRLVDLIWQGLTASVVFSLARRLSDQRAAGPLAAIVYALTYYHSGGYWHIAQTDGFATLPAALGVLAVTRTADETQSRLRSMWAPLAGVAFALAALFKYPVGVALLVFAMAYVVIYGRGRPRIFLEATLLALGFGATLGGFALVGAWQGSLGPFWEIQTKFIPAYNHFGGHSYAREAITGFARFLIEHKTFSASLLGALVGCALAWQSGVLSRGLLVVLFLVAGVAHLVVQNKFYGYHGLPMLAPAAVLQAYAAVAIWEKLRRHVAFRRLVAAGALAAAAWVLVGNAGAAGELARVAFGSTTLREIWDTARFGGYADGGDYSLKADLQVADYLRLHSKPSDTVFIWGFEPTVYFAADRQCASRFIYNFPLYGRVISEGLRAQLMQDLHSNEPLYFMVVRNDDLPHVTGTPLDSRESLPSFPELELHLRTNYQLETTIEDFELYRRKGASPAASVHASLSQ